MPKVSSTEQQQQFVLANLSYSEDVRPTASVDVSAQLQVGGRSALGRVDRSHFYPHSGTPAYPYRFRIRGSCPIGVPKTKLFWWAHQRRWQRAHEVSTARAHTQSMFMTHSLNPHAHLALNLRPTPCLNPSEPICDGCGGVGLSGRRR